MKKKGCKIFWLNITNMIAEDGWTKSQITHRNEQIEAIKNFYRFDGFYNFGFPAAKLFSFGEGQLIEAIKKVFEDIKPDWIIIPGQYDAHSDHRIVYNCCMSCAKTFRASYIRRITTMEILSESDYGFQKEKFDPNLFIDITDELDGKLEAMEIYDTEIEEVPFPRSIENIKALASIRGGACSAKFAEAFCIIKQIE